MAMKFFRYHGKVFHGHEFFSLPWKSFSWPWIFLVTMKFFRHQKVAFHGSLNILHGPLNSQTFRIRYSWAMKFPWNMGKYCKNPWKVTVERWRHGLGLKLLTLGVGDSLLFPLFSFSDIESTGARDCLPPRVWVIWVLGRIAIFQR